MILLVFLVSITVHELGHGIVADRLGDGTARTRGRLGVNPLRHLSGFGSLVLPLLTAFIYQLPVGYAKPVPVDPRQFPHRKRGLVMVGVAGPAASLSLAMAFGLGFRAASWGVVQGWIAPGLTRSILEGLRYGVIINLILGFFNLLPLPPLDGFRVVRGLSPNRGPDPWGAPSALVLGGLVAFVAVAPGWVRKVLDAVLGPVYTWLTGARFYL